MISSETRDNLMVVTRRQILRCYMVGTRQQAYESKMKIAFCNCGYCNIITLRISPDFAIRSFTTSFHNAVRSLFSTINIVPTLPTPHSAPSIIQTCSKLPASSLPYSRSTSPARVRLVRWGIPCLLTYLFPTTWAPLKMCAAGPALVRLSLEKTLSRSGMF